MEEKTQNGNVPEMSENVEKTNIMSNDVDDNNAMSDNVEINNNISNTVEKRRTESEISPESEAAGAVVESWRRQAEELRALYPGFDLSREMQNARFRGCLKCGGSLKEAYESLHIAEIMADKSAAAEKNALSRAAGLIACGARFPSEGALSTGSTGTMKSGVAMFSKRDRESIIRRAAGGERIVL